VHPFYIHDVWWLRVSLGIPELGNKLSSSSSSFAKRPRTTPRSSTHQHLIVLTMAPPARARSLPKSLFLPTFSKLKTLAYVDNPNLRPNVSVSSSHFIRTLSWNAPGTFIATGAADRTLRIWNPEKPNVKNSTELRAVGVSGAVSLERVAFHPINENELASCSTDGFVRFWDVRSKASVGAVQVGEQPFTLAWRPDGTEIVAGRKVRLDEVDMMCIRLQDLGQHARTNRPHCTQGRLRASSERTNKPNHLRLVRHTALPHERGRLRQDHAIPILRNRHHAHSAHILMFRGYHIA